MGSGDRLPRPLSGAEQEALLDELNTRYYSPHRNQVMMRLMLGTGLRAGEVVALGPEHLDLEMGRLVVREGKGAKERALWFSAGMTKAIRDWLDRRPDSPYLFPTQEGNQLSTRYLRKAVKRVAKKADLSEADRISPHTLRHTFATDLYRETHNIRLVQKALGHANLSTTMIYTHIVDEELEDALKGFRS